MSPTFTELRDEGAKAIIPVETVWSSVFSPASQNSADPLEEMSLERGSK